MRDSNDPSIDGARLCSVLDCHSEAAFSQPLPPASADGANGHALYLCPIHFLEFQELSTEPFMSMHILRDASVREGTEGESSPRTRDALI